MGKQCKNEIGNRYGKWLVVQKASERNSYGDVCWICQCDCGTIKTISGKVLRRGKSKSCGCTITPIKIGDVFGELTVIEESSLKDKYNHKYWKCKCSCGKETVVRGTNLKNGNTTTCGCKKASHGEQKVKKLLEELNINYQAEYSIPDLGRKRFDFAIFSDKGTLISFIQYDGIQHFVGWNRDSSSLKERQERDKEKNEWARQHKIPLYRIPYWELDNLNQENLFSKKFLV